MRCRICDIPHKNTNHHRFWIQNQICRVCSYFFEFFSFNSNHLKEYWEEEEMRKNFDHIFVEECNKMR